MKFSHSAIQRYKTCPESYRLRYIERFVSIKKSSALYFGSAVDEALNVLLLDRTAIEKAKQAFEKHWTTGKDNSQNPLAIRDSLDITYAVKDFDADLLTNSPVTVEEIETFKLILANKKEHGWDKLPEVDQLEYNRIIWYCLLEKGKLFIQAYADQILPKLKKVISIQKELVLDNGAGDQIIGFLDLIAELENGTKAILDNKTTSVKYELDSVLKSDQLALYKLIMETNEPEADITKAGYLVVDKNLVKVITKTCQSCGHIRIGGSHASCDNLPDGKKRCAGIWDRSVAFKVNTQIIVDTISEEFQDKILNDFNEINAKIKAGIFEQNKQACYQPWGPCEFMGICHKNTDKGLVKLPPKKDFK